MPNPDDPSSYGGGAPGGAPGAGAGGAAATTIPKSPLGGPGGPGASPMLSTGGGAGNRAAAMQSVKGLIPGLLKASMSFDSGSKEQQALLRAISALNPIFAGRGDVESMVPAGLAALAQQRGMGAATAAPPPGAAAGAGSGPGAGAGAGMENLLGGGGVT